MSANRIEVANVADFDGDNSRVLVDIKGREIAVFFHDGEYYAVANYCIHQAGPLCEGALTGNTTTKEDGWDWEYDTNRRYISCPWHGWTFDIESGENVNDGTYAVPTYDLEVDDGTIYLIQ